MKIDFTSEECFIITQALGLKRDSLIRARRKEITGSELFNVYNRQLADLNSLDRKFNALVDPGVK